MQAGNKVILNTLILYAKMAVTILVGLLSTRLVLRAMGVDDYGLYNLVVGIVSMLTFLNTSLAVSTQRFLSFVLGQDDNEYLKKVFYYSFVLHVVIGIVIVILIEVLGVPGIKYFLNIDPQKINDATIMLHLLCISVFLTVMSVPYIAVLISRENMFMLSCVDIVGALIKLLGAIYLLYYDGNRLILYTIVIVSEAFITLIIKIAICRYKYYETSFSLHRIDDKSLLKNLTSFTGWYTFASIGAIGRNQGVPVLLNIFFGVILNAAYAIANQINGLLNFFSTAILQSIRPQITKSEGARNRNRVCELSLIACRYMFYLCAFFSIPLVIEMPFVLHIWLGDYPDYTIGFCRLILATTMIYMCTGGLGAAIDATGNIKWTYVTAGILHFLNIPVGYVLLKLGFSVYSVLWSVLVEEFICLGLRVYYAKSIVGISVKSFLIQVFIPIIIICTCTIVAGISIYLLLNAGLLRFIVCCAICGMVFMTLCLTVGMRQDERLRFINILNNNIYKKKRK